ncbi:MAG: endonuclease/exonuclease/phosphatase family protein [Myxococcota bacterium]
MLAFAVLLLVVAFVVFFFWASGGDSDSELVSPGDSFENVAATAPAPGKVSSLTVVSFNIGYARGPAGDDSGPWDESIFRQNLDAIAQQIAGAGADVAFLQEVDLGASRSHDIDEARVLLERLGWRYGTCVVTWEKNYVPFPYWPPSKHYGRMKSGQCVLSRFPIEASTRYRMPQPDENPWWRNKFYLNRAIDHVKLAINGQSWDVFNVHLEAFDVANRMDHARFLVELVKRVAGASPRVVVAGDFNALPTGAAQRKGFIDEPGADFSADLTHDIVGQGLPQLREVMPDLGVFTFPADAPTRRLDYIWYGAALALDEAKVLTAPPGPWSDHLPIMARWHLL